MRRQAVLLAIALSCMNIGRVAAQTEAARPALRVPLACQIGRDCEIQHYVDRDPGPGVRDYHCGARTYQGHDGIDFRVLDMAAQRRGVDVVAAAAGRVTRLRDGVADISIRAAGAPKIAGIECGNGVVIDHGAGWETQYCHMARGSLRVKVGEMVAAGQPIGRVGLSGLTEFPHLHLTVRHAGQVVDPFAPDSLTGASCAASHALWAPDALKVLTYKEGAILNLGFAAQPVQPAEIEEGAVPAVSPAASALVFYVRAIGLAAGDEIEMRIIGPDGQAVAQNRLKPLESAKDQYVAYVGRKRPPAGWPHGVYQAEIQVYRRGAVALARRTSTRL